LSTILSLIDANFESLVDLSFVFFGLSSLYYFINTIVYEISCLAQSFNERQRKAALDKSGQNELDALIAKHGAKLAAVIAYFLM
jgi:hypothetical protein